MMKKSLDTKDDELEGRDGYQHFEKINMNEDFFV